VAHTKVVHRRWNCLCGQVHVHAVTYVRGAICIATEYLYYYLSNAYNSLIYFFHLTIYTCTCLVMSCGQWRSEGD